MALSKHALLSALCESGALFFPSVCDGVSNLRTSGSFCAIAAISGGALGVSATVSAEVADVSEGVSSSDFDEFCET